MIHQGLSSIISQHLSEEKRETNYLKIKHLLQIKPLNRATKAGISTETVKVSHISCNRELQG